MFPWFLLFLRKPWILSLCLIEQSLCRLVVGGARPLLMVCAGTLDGCAVAVPDPGQGQWSSVHVVLFSLGQHWWRLRGCGCLQLPSVLLGSHGCCWNPPDLFPCWGISWRRRSLLRLSLARGCPHSSGGTDGWCTNTHGSVTDLRSGAEVLIERGQLQGPGHWLSSSSSGSVPELWVHVEQPWSWGLEHMCLQRIVALGSWWSTGTHGTTMMLGSETWVWMEQMELCGQGHTWGWGLTNLVPGWCTSSFVWVRSSSISSPGGGQSMVVVMVVMAIGDLSHKSCWCPLWSRLLRSVPVKTTGSSAVKTTGSLPWGLLSDRGRWGPPWSRPVGTVMAPAIQLILRASALLCSSLFQLS